MDKLIEVKNKDARYVSKTFKRARNEIVRRLDLKRYYVMAEVFEGEKKEYLCKRKGGSGESTISIINDAIGVIMELEPNAKLTEIMRTYQKKYIILSAEFVEKAENMKRRIEACID